MVGLLMSGSGHFSDFLLVLINDSFVVIVGKIYYLNLLFRFHFYSPVRVMDDYPMSQLMYENLF